MMTTTRLIPTPESVTTPAIDEVVRRIPAAVKHIDQGAYGDVLHGWMSQARVARAELAELAADNRLSTAEGEPLKTLARSWEFGAPVPEGSTAAVGFLVLVREVTGLETVSFSALFAQGGIQPGTRFRRAANSALVPPVAEAIMEVTAPVVVDNSSHLTSELVGETYTARQTNIIVPVRALTTGAGANQPVFALSDEVFDAATPALKVEAQDPLFDSNLTVTACFLAGGGSGAADDVIRHAATAAFLGRRGATVGALVMGALCGNTPDAQEYGPGFGVAHVVPVFDRERRVERLHVADSSWASNPQWCAAIQTFLRTHYQGFGCLLEVVPVLNRKIVVKATVHVSNASDLANPAPIRSNIQRAVQKHLDAKPDFFTWSVGELGGVVATSDTRLMACSYVSVQDENGVTIPEPPADPGSSAVTHWWLEGVNIQFLGPL